MDGIMEYKGYRAKVEYSPGDETFIGKVFGIADTLVFDGQSIEELQTMFRASIDDYLELCREIGNTTGHSMPDPGPAPLKGFPILWDQLLHLTQYCGCSGGEVNTAPPTSKARGVSK